MVQNIYIAISSVKTHVNFLDLQVNNLTIQDTKTLHGNKEIHEQKSWILLLQWIHLETAVDGVFFVQVVLRSRPCTCPGPKRKRKKEKVEF